MLDYTGYPMLCSNRDDSIPVCSLARDQNSDTITGITDFSKVAAQNELINDDLRSKADD